MTMAIIASVACFGQVEIAAIGAGIMQQDVDTNCRRLPRPRYNHNSYYSTTTTTTPRPRNNESQYPVPGYDQKSYADSYYSATTRVRVPEPADDFCKEVRIMQCRYFTFAMNVMFLHSCACLSVCISDCRITEKVVNDFC